MMSSNWIGATPINDNWNKDNILKTGSSDPATMFNRNFDILNYIIYFDGTYLVIKQDNGLSYFKVNSSLDKLYIAVGDDVVEFYGEEIESEELPEYPKSIVTKEMI